MSNGTVSVSGIPKSFTACMDILDAGKKIAIQTFIMAAKDNRLSDNLIIDESNLVLPKPGLLVPNVG